MTTAADVKALVMAHLAPSLRAHGYGGSLPNDLDLRSAGIIDSFGFVNLVAVLERRLGRTLDLSELAAGELTKIGPLCRHIAENGG